MGGYYGPAGGGGGGSDDNGSMITGEWTGPSSYPTGGFQINLASSFSTVTGFDLQLSSVGSISHHFEAVVTLNDPSAGIVKVKLNKLRYDKVSATGNVASQPSGVTVQTTSGQTSSSEAAHTHAIDHDHGSFSSAANNSSGVSTLLDALGPAGMNSHTHTLNLPNLTGTSGAGTSHNHADNTLYDHRHAITQATTAMTRSEIANATDLSSMTWDVLAFGTPV